MKTTVDQKGSVALPEDLLRDSDIHPGDELEILIDDGNITLRKTDQPLPTGLLDILRSLKGLPISERNRSSVRDVPL